MTYAQLSRLRNNMLDALYSIQYGFVDETREYIEKALAILDASMALEFPEPSDDEEL